MKKCHDFTSIKEAKKYSLFDDNTRINMAGFRWYESHRGNENVKVNIKMHFFDIVNQRLGKSFINVISVPDFFYLKNINKP